MHDSPLVQIAKCQDNLGTDKLDSGLSEPSHFVNVVIDVASWQVLEEEVNLELVLEDKVHRVDERVVRLEQNVLLVLDVLHLLLLE